jgi:preprotein translocase subunit SecG
METLLLVINIILAIILVLLVLLQKSEGGALGIGVSQENFMLSRSAGSFMTKATAIVATLFIRYFHGAIYICHWRRGFLPW